MLNRRSLLASLSRIPLLGLFGSAEFHAAAFASTEPGQHNAIVGRDIYKDLGVSTFINAGEPFTSLSGGPIRQEVKDAMTQAEKSYVRLMDVQNAVGRHLAGLLGAGGAMITAGAASGLTLGTAACMTGKDPIKIKRLPDVEGMPDQVIIQKAHRYDYEHAVRNCGVKMIEVESREQLVNAIGPKTACLLFNNRWNANGQIRHEGFVEIGKAHGIPTFNDCASDVPPADNLTKFTKMGFDLVTFSGGKNLRAPSSTGLLIGRNDLIEAAKMNHEPEDDVIGRGMKVNKEEMIGLMVAIELCLKEDPDPIFVESQKRLDFIAEKLSSIPGLTMEMFEPPVSYKVPHLRITWDEKGSRPSPDQLRRLLRQGNPPIVTRTGPDPVKGLEITSWMLSSQDIPVLIHRITSLLT
jgi:L-seryl-tRNA(Ser) seleniumtransferase